jgi:DNA polymerase I-like protein with 3'-5' exonuclease and polymerase domains
MSYIPAIEKLHALRDSIGVVARAKLPIGVDHRNRPSLFPFGTATSRNAHAKSLFNAHAGMRGFMVAPPEKILVYLDWASQEIAVLAAKSRDPMLMHDYTHSDVYHALARVTGFTDNPDPDHWKESNPDQRQRMKSLQLAINYGMSVPTLARGLNRHPLIASTVMHRYNTHYAVARQCAVTEATMLSREIKSVLGWPLRLSTSPNKKTLFNFPMQSGGAAMLQLAAVRLCEVGLIPSMLVHDGILLEVDTLEQIEQAKEIMHGAGRDVCDGFEVRVSVDQQLENGARYCDKRPTAKALWASIMDVLQTVTGKRKAS